VDCLFVGYPQVINKRDEERIRTFEILGLRRILRVSNEQTSRYWKRPERSLLEAIKKRKLTYLGYTMRKHDSLEKDIITGKRARGRPKTSWMNNITAWTGLMLNVILRKTEERTEWRAVNPGIEED